MSANVHGNVDGKDCARNSIDIDGGDDGWWMKDLGVDKDIKSINQFL